MLVFRHKDLTRARVLCFTITMKYPNKNRQKRKEAEEMRLSGMTYKAIAKEFGVSRQRIQQLIAPPKIIRDVVIKRAQGRCQDCGILVNNQGHVHHRENDTGNYNDSGNLRLLCISCHRKAHNETGNQRYVLSGKKTILVSQEVKKRLAELGHKNDSWDDIIAGLLGN